MSTAVVGYQWPHVVPEQVMILRYISRRINTVTMLKRRTGYGERRVQRRVSELLAKGWIEQVGVHTDVSVSLRVFGVTEEGSRNVPYGL